MISLPFAALHQAQQPVIYSCETCEKEFGVRSWIASMCQFILFVLLATIGLVILAVFFGF